MTSRCRPVVLGLLVVVAGGWLASGLPAQEPARFTANANATLQPQPGADRKMAQTIAEHLRQSGLLQHYTINVTAYRGTVELTGSVLDVPQRQEVVRIVQGVLGVERVIDRLTVVSRPIRVQADAKPDNTSRHRRRAGSLMKSQAMPNLLLGRATANRLLGRATANRLLGQATANLLLLAAATANLLLGQVRHCVVILDNQCSHCNRPCARHPVP